MKMNKKLMAVPMLVIIALVATGFAYAMWKDTLTIEGTIETGTLEWEFAGPYGYLDHPGDNDTNANCTWHFWETEKDAGGPTNILPIDTDGDGDADKLNVTFVNVYPGYAEEISFYVHCKGSIPLIFEKIIIDGQTYYEWTPGQEQIFLDLSGDDVYDTKIRWGNHLGYQFEPCESKEISFSILFLQEMPEGETFYFTIELVGIQYNYY
jgi:hypothetical protein